MTQFNQHEPTIKLRQRISDLACAGIPLYIIADIVELDDATIKKYYRRELATAQAEAVNRINKVVMTQAIEGNEKSQALYLKTQGAKFGFVEKQVIEQTESKETEELRSKISELEEKYVKDY